jgi:hypothetical protein
MFTLGRDGVVRVSGDAVASVRWLEPTGLEGFSAVQLLVLHMYQYACNKT